MSAFSEFPRLHHLELFLTCTMGKLHLSHTEVGDGLVSESKGMKGPLSTASTPLYSPSPMPHFIPRIMQLAGEGSFSTLKKMLHTSKTLYLPL